MTTPDLPACCIPSENASAAERAYCAYNAAGDSIDGPTWADLPDDLRDRWESAVFLLGGARFAPSDVVRLKSGGQPMTVEDGRFDRVDCVWMADGVLRRFEGIPAAALVRVEPVATVAPAPAGVPRAPDDDFMDFGGALAAIKAGKMASRQSWTAGAIVSRDNLDRWLDPRTPSGWRFDADDLLAEDWFVVGEAE